MLADIAVQVNMAGVDTVIFITLKEKLIVVSFNLSGENIAEKNQHYCVINSTG